MYKVYGTRICLYCDKAENLLKTKDLPFEKIEFSSRVVFVGMIGILLVFAFMLTSDSCNKFNKEATHPVEEARISSFDSLSIISYTLIRCAFM